jgi:hypothetical protein
MSGPYEIHVTVDPPVDGTQRETFERLAALLAWSTSEIARDPALGNAVRFYFTTHAPSEIEARSRLGTLVGALIAREIPVLREKVEHVVYDTKGCGS